MSNSSESGSYFSSQEDIQRLINQKIDSVKFDESWRRSKIESFRFLLDAKSSGSALSNSAVSSRYSHKIDQLDALETALLAKATLVENISNNITSPGGELAFRQVNNEELRLRYTLSDPSSAWHEFDCIGRSEILLHIDAEENSFLKLKFNTQQEGEIHAAILINAIGGTLRLNLESDFLVRNSSANITIICISRNGAHVDVCNKQLHYVPACKSDTLFKFIAMDKSYVTFWGLIDIEEGCQESDAYQLARGLLASPNSRADLIPNLRIKANNVRCTHGASYSVLDKSTKFYLQSRAIPAVEAERVLMQGFLLEAVERLPESFKEEAERFIITQQIKNNQAT